MTHYTLSPEQLDFYSSQGYLLVLASEHNLINSVDLHTWANEVRNWPRESGKWMPYDEVNSSGEKQLMRTECFVDYHPKLKQLICGEGLLSILGQLSGNARLPSSLQASGNESNISKGNASLQRQD